MSGPRPRRRLLSGRRGWLAALVVIAVVAIVALIGLRVAGPTVRAAGRVPPETTTPSTSTPSATTGTGAPSTPSGSDPAFYDPPAALPAQDGDVIRSEPVTVPLPARATRVMYRSTDVDGHPIAVTGTVLVPPAPPPGPLRLISFAAGTQGMADRCAPSHQLPMGTEYESGTVEALLERGFAVGVTDYQGLGTPGVHTYVIRQAEAHAVLDMARAAPALGVGIPPGGPVGLVGYSQGGGASAAAAELAPRYAPELHLVGAYAGAVPADLASVAAYLDAKGAVGLLGYALDGLDAAYPSLGVTGILNARGQAFLAETREQCVQETASRYPGVRSSELTLDGRPLAARLADEPLRTRVEEQRIGTLTPRVPVLIAHSVADDIVPFDQDADLARRWCSQGATVTFAPVAASTHGVAASAAFPAAIAFLEARFAGVPPVPGCAPVPTIPVPAR